MEKRKRTPIKNENSNSKSRSAKKCTPVDTRKLERMITKECRILSDELVAVQKRDSEVNRKLEEMIKEVGVLKQGRLHPDSGAEEIKSESAQSYAKQILKYVYIMQKAAFEQQIDTKFPFFFTQLNKIKLSVQKMEKILKNSSEQIQPPINSNLESRANLLEQRLNDLAQEYAESVKEITREKELLQRENQELQVAIQIKESHIENLQNELNNILDENHKFRYSLTLSRPEAGIDPQSIKDTIKPSEPFQPIPLEYSSIPSMETVRTASFKQNSIDSEVGYHQKSAALRTYIEELGAELSDLQQTFARNLPS